MTGDTRYLLDTNIVSETRRRRPAEQVISFLAARTASQLFLGVLTIGELAKGIEAKRRSDPAAADLLAGWLTALQADYRDRILTVDNAVAVRWGALSADRPRPVVDTLLAATASVHGLTLVTRNTTDLHGLPVALLDPWRAPPAGTSPRHGDPAPS